MKKSRSDNHNYNNYLWIFSNFLRKKNSLGVDFFLIFSCTWLSYSKIKNLWASEITVVKKNFWRTHIFLDIFGLLIFNVGIFNL